MNDELEDWEKERFERWIKEGKDMRLKVILSSLNREQVFALLTLFAPWDPQNMGMHAPEQPPDLVDPTDPE